MPEELSTMKNEKCSQPLAGAAAALGVCGGEPENPKRRAILDAAGRLFLERGFNATSMDAIAEAAPVSKPTLYSHFKDKSDLFAAVINGRCCSLVYSLYEHTSAEDEDIETTLRAIANSFFDVIYSSDSLSLYRIIISELKQFPQLGEALYQQGPVKVLTLLSAYLVLQNEKGRLQIADPEMAARHFFSMLKGDRHMQCLLGICSVVPPEERVRIIDSVVTLFVDGYRNCKKP